MFDSQHIFYIYLQMVKNGFDNTVPLLEPNTLDFMSHSEAQTHRLGARLSTLLHVGDVIALNGELGTGKTRWVQGICMGLGVTDRVNSPTFTLVNEYSSGRLPVYHIDLYRLATIAESDTFGLEDYIYGNGVTVIEWAERAKPLLPPQYLSIELHHLAETRRRVVVRPYGTRFHNVMQQFKTATFAHSGAG